MKFRRIIYSRDIVFDKNDHKICSLKNVIEIHAENENQQRNDLSIQQEEILITVQIDQSDKFEKLDNLSDLEEKKNDLIDFFHVNISDEEAFSFFEQQIISSCQLQEAQACLTTEPSLESAESSKSTETGTSTGLQHPTTE